MVGVLRRHPAERVYLLETSLSTERVQFLSVMTRIAHRLPSMRSRLSAICVGLGVLSSSVPIHAGEPISLTWPVACEPGQTCFVQNFVDHDSRSGAARDFRCGSRTYDGHDGTDIRLPDAEELKRGISVLAAAAGRVLRTRDGINDVSIRVTGRAAVAGKECGNGVVVDHGEGWSTQYCHLKQGSIIVAPGQRIQAGAVLGQIGLSGETEVPHLHLTVRHTGTVIDPFAYDQPVGTCSGGQSLWAGRMPEGLQYRDREIINYGFAGAVVAMDDIESGALRQHQPRPDSLELVAYARAIGLRKGDIQVITIRFPDGSTRSESRLPALDRDKAEFFISTGRRRDQPRWPHGTYQASYRVLNNGAEVLVKTFDAVIE